MKQIEFEIKGICPLKMDRWIDDPQPKNDKGYMEQAKKKVYLDSKKNIAIPACAVKACMRIASSEVGKKTDAKKNRQTIMSGIFIEPDMLSIGKKTYDLICRDIVTRGQGTKVTRVPSYRPLIKEWKCSGKMNLFNADVDFVKSALESGGLRYGLLSHRPEFGRFIITKWKVENENNRRM